MLMQVKYKALRRESKCGASQAGGWEALNTKQRISKGRHLNEDKEEIEIHRNWATFMKIYNGQQKSNI